MYLRKTYVTTIAAAMISPTIVHLFEEPGLFALSIIRSSTNTIPTIGKSNQNIASIFCILIHHAITTSLLIAYNA
jgi:hypothetical protein